MPKTGGTTTDRLFELSGLPLLWRDPQSSPLKHVPPIDHPNLPPLMDRTRVINIRRLPQWLLSNWQHKRGLMGLDLEPQMMCQGFFYRHKDQKWYPADWWLDLLGVNESWVCLRLEYLKGDLLKTFADFEPIGWKEACSIRLARERNRNSYSRTIEKWFSAKDLTRIYEMNPRWTALEVQCYGKTLDL